MKALKIFKFNFLVIYFFLILSLFLIGEAFAATIYYVDKDNVHGSFCSDNNDGKSWSTAFCTIQKAADVVSAGDTVIVADGVYTKSPNCYAAEPGDCVIEVKHGGTANKWVTFKAENKWGVKLNGENNQANVAISHSPNVSFVRIEGFEMYGFKWVGVIAGTDCSNLYLYQNKIHDIGRRYLDPCENYEEAIKGASAFSVRSSASYITIDSNLVYDIGRLPGGACEQYHSFDYNHDHGIYMSGDYITIINNIFYGCKAGWVIHAYNDNSSVSIDHLKIINNTFSDANPERDGHILLGRNNNNNDVIIENNIFYNPRSSGITCGSCTGKTNIIIKNNISTNAITNPTLAECSIMVNNQNNTDPKFINATIHNFHLQSDSPTIDKGLSFPERTKDANGNSIVGAPDIGAYEYGGTPSGDTVPPAPPTIIKIE